MARTIGESMTVEITTRIRWVGVPTPPYVLRHLLRLPIVSGAVANEQTPLRLKLSNQVRPLHATSSSARGGFRGSHLKRGRRRGP